MTGAAQLASTRTHSGPGFGGSNVTVAAPFPASGSVDVDVGAENAESVIRVVTAQPDLALVPDLTLDLRRREGEPLGGDVDDLRSLLASADDGRACRRRRPDRSTATTAD